MTPPRVRDVEGRLTLMKGGPYDGKVLRVFETDQHLLTWEGLGGAYVADDSTAKGKSKMGKKASATMTWDERL